tara:strand:+ start:72 stop:545 length:474 start_codon:yes stop_codon:yes gene_type:complete
MILVSDEEWEEHRKAPARAKAAEQRERKKAAEEWYRFTHKEERKVLNKKWRDENPGYAQEKSKVWNTDNPIRVKYSYHKGGAKSRGIPFHMTIFDWWAEWCSSGKWEERGKGADKYCMCRTGDEGPYEYGNVRIDTNENNLAESREIRSKLKGLDDE